MFIKPLLPSYKQQQPREAYFPNGIRKRDHSYLMVECDGINHRDQQFGVRLKTTTTCGFFTDEGEWLEHRHMHCFNCIKALVEEVYNGMRDALPDGLPCPSCDDGVGYLHISKLCIFL